VRERWRSPAARGAMALLAVLLLGAAWNGHGAFFRQSLHLTLWDSVSVVGLVAIGQCLVILGGGIDLSVGAVLALCGTTFGGLQLAAGWHWLPATLAALALGAAFGAATGWLIARWRLQPFLATLAAMVIARGLARFVPELAGKPAGSKFMPPGAAVPESWQCLSGHVLLGLPTTGLLWLLVAASTWAFVGRTVPGRHLLAIGGNEEAAHLSGVATQRTKVLVYALCALLAALAGVCTVARDGFGDPGAGEQYELKAIAAVVVGGTSLQGGRGGIGLAVLGVFTLGYIDRILSINSVAAHWQLVIQGAIILAAVLLQQRRR